MKKAFILIYSILIPFVVCKKEKKVDYKMLLPLLATNSSSAASATLNLDLTFTSLLKEETTELKSVLLQTTENQNISIMGSLLTNNTRTNKQETNNLSVALTSDLKARQAGTTLLFIPDRYDFYLLLERKKTNEQIQQYAGSSIGVLLKDGINNVPIEIKPVIGNSITDMNKVTTLSSFNLRNNLVSTDIEIANPNIGITINDLTTGIQGTEQKFEVNRTLSILEYYINIEEGQKEIKLNYYDGNNLIGKSIPEQEKQEVKTGRDIVMDLIPVVALCKFNISQETIHLTSVESIVGTVTLSDGKSFELYLSIGSNGMVTSNKTFATLPGAYTFTLELEKDGTKYTGSTDTTIVEGTNQISITLRKI
jgi:hypothetical protein